MARSRDQAVAWNSFLMSKSLARWMSHCPLFIANARFGGLRDSAAYTQNNAPKSPTHLKVRNGGRVGNDFSHEECFG